MDKASSPASTMQAMRWNRLCLSVFMMIGAIIRIAGFKYMGLEDDTWQFYWQHAEGTIAVMMASITAFRTLFVRPPVNLNEDITTPRSPVEMRESYTSFLALSRFLLVTTGFSEHRMLALEAEPW